MKKVNRDTRTVLICTIVAYLFDKFSRDDRENFRPKNWTPESMIEIISSEIKNQARLHGFSVQVQKQMVQDALRYYDNHFIRAMNEIHQLQIENKKLKKKRK
jgi:hypothetical protein